MKTGGLTVQDHFIRPRVKNKGEERRETYERGCSKEMLTQPLSSMVKVFIVDMRHQLEAPGGVKAREAGEREGIMGKEESEYGNGGEQQLISRVSSWGECRPGDYIRALRVEQVLWKGSRDPGCCHGL